MKFSTWQVVAILAILLTAIVVSYVFAPGASTVIVSMATTVFAALFVQRRDPELPPLKPSVIEIADEDMKGPL